MFIKEKIVINNKKNTIKVDNDNGFYGRFIKKEFLLLEYQPITHERLVDIARCLDYQQYYLNDGHAVFAYAVGAPVRDIDVEEVVAKITIDGKTAYYDESAEFAN